jgi:hypothetical protein
MTTRRLTLVIAVLLWAGGVGSAQAADFTFRVPVDAKGLTTEVRGITLWCRVMVSGDQDLIGGSSMIKLVPDTGILQETVTLEFNADAGKNPADARKWRCSLGLLSKQSVSATPNAGYSGGFAKAKAGAPLVTDVSGDLP